MAGKGDRRTARPVLADIVLFRVGQRKRQFVFLVLKNTLVVQNREFILPAACEILVDSGDDWFQFFVTCDHRDRRIDQRKEFLGVDIVKRKEDGLGCALVDVSVNDAGLNHVRHIVFRLHEDGLERKFPRCCNQIGDGAAGHKRTLNWAALSNLPETLGLIVCIDTQRTLQNRASHQVGIFRGKARRQFAEKIEFVRPQFFKHLAAVAEQRRKRDTEEFGQTVAKQSGKSARAIPVQPEQLRSLTGTIYKRTAARQKRLKCFHFFRCESRNVPIGFDFRGGIRKRNRKEKRAYGGEYKYKDKTKEKYPFHPHRSPSLLVNCPRPKSDSGGKIKKDKTWESCQKYQKPTWLGLR